MQTQLTTATNEAAAAKAAVTAEREARTEIVLTRAVNEGRISQAQRPEWKGKLIAATDFSATETELGNLKKAVNTKSAVADLGARKGEQAAYQSSTLWKPPTPAAARVRTGPAEMALTLMP